MEVKYDLCPYKKGKFEQRDNAQRKDNAKRHKEKMAIYKPCIEDCNT